MSFEITGQGKGSNNHPPPYEILYIDADTVLFKAAKSVQKDYIIVTHKKTKWTKRFDNVTSFFGHWKKKEGGWLAEVNKTKVVEGKPTVSAEDFEIESLAELVELTDNNHLEEAMKQIDFFVGKMKRMNVAKEYRLCIGGEGNFRYDSAQLQPYKGKRTDKPLIFQELKDAVIQKYGSKIIPANDREADDVLGEKGYENYKHFLKTGVWRDVLGFIDKDLKMIISPSFNYEDRDPKIVNNTPEEAALHFCVQLLAGDLSTDNILGLPNLTEEIREKYKLGKTKGIGMATASRYLQGCSSIKEMFEHTVEAYRSYYGEGKQPLKSFRGEDLNWNYLDYMQENAILLWMQRYDGERYSIRDTLSRLKIKH